MVALRPWRRRRERLGACRFADTANGKSSSEQCAESSKIWRTTGSSAAIGWGKVGKVQGAPSPGTPEFQAKNRNIFFSPSILMVVTRRMSGICGSRPIACSRLQFVNTISVELAPLTKCQIIVLRPPVYVIQFCRRPRVGINSWNYDVRVIGKHGSSAPHQRITQPTS